MSNIPPPRLAAIILALVTPGVAYRFQGSAVWMINAVAMVIAAAATIYVLWQDELLETVFVPKGWDGSVGLFAVTVPLYTLLGVVMLMVIAPDNEPLSSIWQLPPGSNLPILRRCTHDGPLVIREQLSWFGKVTEFIRAETCRGYAHATGVTGLWRGILVVIIASLEEVVWRGSVQEQLSEKFGSTRGWLITSGLFGLAQLATGNVAIALLAFIGGLLWGALYRYRGRITPALISHAAFSYTAFYTHPYMFVGNG